MKRIVFILSILFILVSCKPKNYEVPTEPTKILRFEDFVDFRTIATTGYGCGYSDEILCDVNTGVLYVHDYGGFLSPIYNADGSLKNIKDYSKVEE